MEFVHSVDVPTQTRVIISNEKLQKLAHLNTLGFGGKNDSMWKVVIVMNKIKIKYMQNENQVIIIL